MKTWSPLKENDVACVIAPSYHSYISNERTEEIIRQSSLTPYIYPNIEVRGNHSI